MIYKLAPINENTMTNATTENFWQAWNNMTWPEPTQISYRLYYTQDGSPILYTMEDLPGDYIEVDAETYALSSFLVRIVNKQLVHIQPRRYVQKLTPNTTGTACDPGDVCVVVSEQKSYTKWKIITNETD